MADPKQPSAAADQSLRGPSWGDDPGQKTSPCVIAGVAATGTPAGALFPLKLTLQPGGLSVQLTQADTLVGRHHDADLRLPLPDVSRRHCRFLFADSCWQVIDLNSTNGVYVNTERVDRTILRHHDTIRIGGFTFVVDLQAGRAAATPTSQQERVLQNIINTLSEAQPKRQAS